VPQMTQALLSFGSCFRVSGYPNGYPRHLTIPGLGGAAPGSRPSVWAAIRWPMAARCLTTIPGAMRRPCSAGCTQRWPGGTRCSGNRADTGALCRAGVAQPQLTAVRCSATDSRTGTPDGPADARPGDRLPNGDAPRAPNAGRRHTEHHHLGCSHLDRFRPGSGFPLGDGQPRPLGTNGPSRDDAAGPVAEESAMAAWATTSTVVGELEDVAPGHLSGVDPARPSRLLGR
jgi:hypothetical protein